MLEVLQTIYDAAKEEGSERIAELCEQFAAKKGYGLVRQETDEEEG